MVSLVSVFAWVALAADAGGLRAEPVGVTDAGELRAVDAGADDGGVFQTADAGRDALEAALLEGETDDDVDEEPAVTGSAENESEGEGARAVDGGLPDGGLLYSADVSDDALKQKWLTEPAALGSLSIGFADSGRLINGVPMPRDPDWQVVVPEAAFGCQETIDALVTVAHAVRRQYPQVAPLRINHIGRQEGGYLRPHQSHQSGRDVDLGFFYKPGVAPVGRNRDGIIDLAANWALLKAIVTQTDVQFVLVDTRIQNVLAKYALSIGEDAAFVDRIFHAGRESIVQYARRHRDHFHVRFFAPRSQELGRRVQPLMVHRPEENLAFHRVKKGDTLGRIAQHYHSTVKLIQKANHMTSSALKIGRTLVVPLRGACTNCPVPPPLILPPRVLPPPAASEPNESAPSAPSTP